MNECTEEMGRWPSAPADVSPDEIDAFLAHAGTCPFHAEQLRAEEEELRSMFRLARGLDSHGRILQGKELKKTIAGHARRQALWQTYAQTTTPPLKRIYLSNGGEDISGSGNFSYFLGYESDHPLLDPRAGLQLWGVFDYEGKTEEVLLGFYPLAGVYHTSEEKFLSLNNGYTVGLMVDQLGERHFKLRFRCVEDAVLEKEQTEVCSRKGKVQKMGAKASAAGKFLLAYASTGLCKYLPPLNSFRERTAMVLATVLLLTVVVGADRRRTGGDVFEATPPTASSRLNGDVLVGEGRPTKAAEDELDAGTVIAKATQGHRSGKPRASAPTGHRGVKPPRAGSTAGSQSPAERDRGLQKGTGGNQPGDSVITNPAVQTEEGCDLKCKPAWQLQSSLHNITTADRRLVAHFGSDEILREKLVAEIHQRNINIEPLNGAGAFLLHEFTATWNIIRYGKSVTVQVIVNANGETKRLTFSRDGTCQEQACEMAVKDAVTGVFAAVLDETDAAPEKQT